MDTSSSNDRYSSVALLTSLRRAVEVAQDGSVPLETRLRRLASVVVADFPKALFKLQVLDAAGFLRVVPDFVTPMLQQIVDSYRSVLGSLDIRNVTLPRDRDSLIEAGLTAYQDFVLQTREEIRQYYTAHFGHSEREALGRVILDDLKVCKVLLLPIRPHDVPFGVISVSSQERFTDVDREYWRTIATAVRCIYRHHSEGTSAELMRVAFTSAAEPTVLVGPEGNAVDINTAALNLLGYSDRAAALRQMRTLKPCLPQRGAIEGSAAEAPGVQAFYIADAQGNDAAYELASTPFFDPDGGLRGVIVRLRPPRTAVPTVRLTVRQREVARLIMDGLTTKEVAAHLGLSLHTVNYHRSQLRRKMAGASNASDLTTALRGLLLGNH
ncbi:MAG: hypothetical protein GVY29_03340 [Spirochaetes bacterium]|jgi:DNA-binding CsgD family transcriptional regulator|nr:hypothetical protein [Spirochaetota bacterium]